MKSFYVLLGAVIGFLLPNIITKARMAEYLEDSGKSFNADGSESTQYLKVLKEEKHTLAQLDSVANVGC